MSATCRLTPAISPLQLQRKCVVSAYRTRAKLLQLKLTPDALAETKLTPEQRANIQARLVTLGFLSDEPDGEFGPNTRSAIRKFQEANGFAQSVFLTAQQRNVLTSPTGPAYKPPAPNANEPRRSASDALAGAPDGCPGVQWGVAEALVIGNRVANRDVARLLKAVRQELSRRNLTRAQIMKCAPREYLLIAKIEQCVASGDMECRFSQKEANEYNNLNVPVDASDDLAQYVQQGAKLVGSDAVGSTTEGIMQGQSVALSADGNTALVGGNGGSDALGAAWVFTRGDGVWTQQGPKLVGSGAVKGALQGTGVALSADGNTAIVGGPGNNTKSKSSEPSPGDGAAWLFTRKDGVWTQLGNKLVGSGAVGTANQGSSVALSADGNTALIGGSGDSDTLGAVWVFTHKDGVWTQQGPKLVGSGAVGKANQGFSVALSADGNTAIVGGMGDSRSLGAAWVFTRKDGGLDPTGTQARRFGCYWRSPARLVRCALG